MTIGGTVYTVLKFFAYLNLQFLTLDDFIHYGTVAMLGGNLVFVITGKQMLLACSSRDLGFYSAS